MKNLKMIKNIYLLLIVCSILVGAVLLIWPQMGVSVMCKVYGVFLLIYGLGKLSGYFTGDLFQLYDFGLGIVSLILGFVLLLRTEHIVEFLAVCIGIFMLVDAALKIQTAIDAKKFGISKWWLILMMAVMVAFVGALLLLAPFETGSILVRVLGLSICIDGIMNLIVVMSTVRSIRRGREDVIDIEL
mgnify:CR=1 FL=1